MRRQQHTINQYCVRQEDRTIGRMILWWCLDWYPPFHCFLLLHCFYLYIMECISMLLHWQPLQRRHYHYHHHHHQQQQHRRHHYYYQHRHPPPPRRPNRNCYNRLENPPQHRPILSIGILSGRRVSEYGMTRGGNIWMGLGVYGIVKLDTAGRRWLRRSRSN